MRASKFYPTQKNGATFSVGCCWPLSARVEELKSRSKDVRGALIGAERFLMKKQKRKMHARYAPCNLQVTLA